MQGSDRSFHLVSARNHRFHLLDALRGIAALIVLLYHLPPNLRFGMAAPISFIAVDFFFCLSGFVIAFSYEERLRGGMSLRDFAVARMIRLYPLYFLGAVLGLLSSLVVTHAALDASVTKGDVFLVSLFGLLLVPNFVARWTMYFCYPLNSPSWSLFCEIVANFAFALLARGRWAKNVVLMSLAMISLGLLAHHVTLGGGASMDLGARAPTFHLGLARVGFSFFIGVLVCRFYLATPQPFAGRRRWLLSAAATATMVAVLLASSGFGQSTAFQLLAIAFIFPAIVYLGACGDLPQSWNRTCAFFGDVSYPLYILHWPLVLALGGRQFQHIAQARPHTAQALTGVWYVFLVVLAWCAGRFYDAPLRRWLTRAYNGNVRRSPRLEETATLVTVP